MQVCWSTDSRPRWTAPSRPDKEPLGGRARGDPTGPRVGGQPSLLPNRQACGLSSGYGVTRAPARQGRPCQVLMESDPQQCSPLHPFHSVDLLARSLFVPRPKPSSPATSLHRAARVAQLWAVTSQGSCPRQQACRLSLLIHSQHTCARPWENKAWGEASWRSLPMRQGGTKGWPKGFTGGQKGQSCKGNSEGTVRRDTKTQAQTAILCALPSPAGPLLTLFGKQSLPPPIL